MALAAAAATTTTTLLVAQVLLGLVASIDPERTEVTPAIKEANQAGVRVVMITGDYLKTARAIAENIGLLPQNSPSTKAVDCSVFRPWAARISEIEQAAGKAPPSSADQFEIKQLQENIDAVTRYSDVYAGCCAARIALHHVCALCAGMPERSPSTRSRL